jgi:hypothetical protein
MGRILTCVRSKKAFERRVRREELAQDAENIWDNKRFFLGGESCIHIGFANLFTAEDAAAHGRASVLSVAAVFGLDWSVD